MRARLLDLAVFLGATPDDLVLTAGTLEGLNSSPMVSTCRRATRS